MSTITNPSERFSNLLNLLHENDLGGLPYVFVRDGSDEQKIQLRLDADGSLTQGELRLHSDGTWDFVPCVE